MSGGEGRQDQSLLSLPPCYPSFQGGRSNCICCWLSSTWDACGQGQGVSLALTLSRNDFQGCNQLHIRALRWEGPLHLPQTLLPLSPLQSRRISATALAPGQLDLFSSPPHMRRGSWAYFILMLSLGFLLFFFSHCTENSISPSGAGGREFSQHGQALHCSLWRGLRGWCQLPPSPTRAWLVSGGVRGTGSAGGGLQH